MNPTRSAKKGRTAAAGRSGGGVSEHEPNTLQRLLDQGRSHDCEYADELSNHLPMALTALHALGASDSRLSAYARSYSRRLLPAPEPQTWAAGQPWAARLGERAAYAAYLDLFDQWLSFERAEAVLRQVLPTLMQGCVAGAFHGLIRTAYAVQAKHLGEVAAGLAYWACRWAPLGALSDKPGIEYDPEAVLRRLRAGRSKAALISQRVQAAAADLSINRLVGELDVDERTLPQLARLAAWAYASSGNFTVLHLLTSAHALRLLLPFCDDDEARLGCVRWYWQAFAFGVVAAGIQRTPEPALQPWERSIAAALASDNDHVIKLVHSCREQAKVHDGVAWHYASSRVVSAPEASRVVSDPAASRPSASAARVVRRSRAGA